MRKIGIVAFAFGAPASIFSNKLIAESASRQARKFNAPVYTQRDVCIEKGIEVEYADERPGNSPPTLRVARGAVDWAKRNKLEGLWIVAAKPHRWRCKRDLVQAVREAKTAIRVYCVNKPNRYYDDSWFCMDSTQKRTRSKKNWENREWILKLLPFFIYKRIAG